MVANTALLSDWFKGRELAFAFGVNLAFSRLGSVFNNIISPIVARRSIIFASWLGALLCAAGVVCVLMTIPIDRFTESQMQENTKYINVSLDQDDLVPLPVIPTESEYHVEMVTLEDAGMENSHPSPKENVGADQNVQWTSMFSFSMVFWILVLSCMTVYGCLLPFNNISSSLLLERDYFRVVPPSCRLQNPQACQSADNLPVFCPASVWYQLPLPANVTMNGITYSPLQPEDVDCSDDAWQSGCTKDYCARKLAAYSQASYVMSIPYLVSAVLSPPIGYWVDLFGMRAMIALVSPLMLILVHMTIAFTHVSPLLPLLGQGLACSGFVAVLWPCVPLVVKEEVTGLAFGIVASMQNLAAAVVPLIVAAVFEASDEKYIPNVELLFVFLAIIGSCVGFCLNHYDSYYGNHVLNSPCLVSCETR